MPAVNTSQTIKHNQQLSHVGGSNRLEVSIENSGSFPLRFALSANGACLFEVGEPYNPIIVVFVSQTVDKIGENNVVESSIKKFLTIFSYCFVLYNFVIMKKIEISDELYSKIEEVYAEIKRNKDKIPPVVYAKYGNSFDSFVEHILNDFIESAKRTQRFQKTFNDMMKDFDVSKLQDELSSLSSLFGLDKEKQKDKEENKSSDPEKTKN